MTLPALEFLALFAGDVPPRSDLAPRETPRFEARRIEGPFPALGAPLEDANQPLTPVERLSAIRARAALHLRCATGAHPAERLPACLDRMVRLAELGAVAVVLPAAHKIIGPDAITAAVHRAGAAWMTVFIHHHSIPEGDRVWYHTHGMEHFGLPDLECRAPLAASARAAALVSIGIRHLLRHGEVQDDAPFVSGPAAVTSEHRYGAWGALELGDLGESAARRRQRPSILLNHCFQRATEAMRAASGPSH